MQKLKISKISELLGIPHTKCKRYAREFLGPDPEATIQSGRARSLTLQETCLVYLGAHLVSDHNFIVHEASIIIGKLKPWLVEFGLFPSGDDNFKEIESEIESWTVFIYRTDKPFYFECKAEGLISSKIEGDTKAGPYEHASVITKKYVKLPILDSDPENAPEVVWWDRNKMVVLRISYLTELFKLRIAGKDPSKPEHFKTLHKHTVLD